MNAETDDCPDPEEHDCDCDGHSLRHIRTERFRGETLLVFRCRYCPKEEIR